MDKTIVALHGNGGGGFRFALSRPYFPDSVHFIAPTFPGFADKPAHPKINKLSDYADWLHANVMEQVEAPVVLLGTGIGGSIAMAYAQKYADSLAGLILHAPVGTRLQSRWFPRLMRVWGMKSLVKGMIASPILRPIWTRRFFVQTPEKAFVDAFFAEYGRCTNFAQMFELITADWFTSLQPTTLPTALLWGGQERVLKVDQLDDYKTLFPNHTVRVVDEWDHFPMIDSPQQFADEVCALSDTLLATSDL